MAVTLSHVVKTLTAYMHDHPGEVAALMPLYEASRDHARRGHCPHDGGCPLVTAGAIVVDERQRVLALRYLEGWAFAEGGPEEADHTLRETALRVLREVADVHDVWTDVTAEGPFIIDVAPAGPEDGARTRYGFRYYFRAHSHVLPARLTDTGQARWLPLASVEIPLHERLRAHLARSP